MCWVVMYGLFEAIVSMTLIVPIPSLANPLRSSQYFVYLIDQH